MRRIFIVAGIFGLLLFGGIFIFEKVFPAEEMDPELELLAEEAAQGLTPEEMAATGEEVPELPEDPHPGVHQDVISTGDTAGALLQTWLPYSEVHVMIAACEDVYSLSKLRAGQPYTVIEDEKGFARFE